MEIEFKNETTTRPVYDYAVKQEWEEHVYYECPAKLTEAEQKAMEKIARATFWALDCRDVARVDLRMDADGRIYVLEVNPLPGLTPGYSDLVLIAKAVGMEYDQLIAEIMRAGSAGCARKRSSARSASSSASARRRGDRRRRTRPSASRSSRRRPTAKRAPKRVKATAATETARATVPCARPSSASAPSQARRRRANGSAIARRRSAGPRSGRPVARGR